MSASISVGRWRMADPWKRKEVIGNATLYLKRNGR